MFDDEQSVTFTEEVGEEAENNELSPVEDNRSTVNVDNGIKCYWRGLKGECCQSLRIFKFKVRSKYSSILVLVGILLVYHQQLKIHNS